MDWILWIIPPFPVKHQKDEDDNDDDDDEEEEEESLEVWSNVRVGGKLFWMILHPFLLLGAVYKCFIAHAFFTHHHVIQ